LAHYSLSRVVVPYAVPAVLCLLLHDTPTTGIYPLSLHDALPISILQSGVDVNVPRAAAEAITSPEGVVVTVTREGQIYIGNASEIGRHTSELQSRENLVCRLLLEKKKKRNNTRSSRRMRSARQDA